MKTLIVKDADISSNGIAKALIEVARAAWQLADNTEERDNEQFICDAGDFSKLSAALDVLDQLPEPLGECATGPRKAEYFYELGSPQPTTPIPVGAASFDLLNERIRELEQKVVETPAHWQKIIADNTRLLAACKMMLRWIELDNQDDPEVEQLTLQTVAEHVEAAVKGALR